MSLPHLSADPQRAPLIASKKCSGRHAARLRRDGITARLSCSFNFLATRGRLKRRPSHNSPKCPKFRGSVSELGQQQVAQKEKTASRRSLRNPVRYLLESAALRFK